jgi:hypothetical protein
MPPDERALPRSTISDNGSVSPPLSILVYSDSESETESQVDDSAEVARHVLEQEINRCGKLYLSSLFFRRALATSFVMRKPVIHHHTSTTHHDTILPGPGPETERILSSLPNLALLELHHHAWERGRVKDEQLVNTFTGMAKRRKGKGRDYPSGFLNRILEREKVTSTTTGGLDPIDFLKEIKRQRKERFAAQRRDTKVVLAKRLSKIQGVHFGN